jgi:exopolyphosphatase / guanosine-5'-triphosphate,3'-diphosphate pyrophosphatase
VDSFEREKNPRLAPWRLITALGSGCSRLRVFVVHLPRAIATLRGMTDAPPPALADSFRIAAIDVGSNSVHMVVAQIDADGGVTTLSRMKEMVGLGRISFPHNELSAEAMDRAVASLGRMKVAAGQRQVEKIVAVATSAIREAANGGELIRRIRDELRLTVRVVSAREEARLIYLGVRGAIDLDGKQHLMLDIGGGSVEFIVGDEREARLLESRKLGAARMTATFVHSDPISDSDLAALREHYDEALVPLAAKVRTLKPARCLGTSGTLENIAALCNDGGDGKADGKGDARVIDRNKLLRLEERLIQSDAADRARIRGLDDQRKEQIVAGVVLVASFMKRLDVKRIELCGAALREGIVADYLSRHKPDLKIRREVPDPRRRSVLDLARRSNWYETHSLHVAKLLLRLFDDLRPLHKLGDAERELIEYGALLHDIGWHIGSHNHHKHSAYLIRHGDLQGFTPEQVRTVAAIARFHRKGEPGKKHGTYRKLSPRDRRTVGVGAALLRLADGLDRSHASAITDVVATIGKQRVTVAATSTVDVQLELWAARDKAAMFERVLGRPVAFEKAG